MSDTLHQRATDTLPRRIREWVVNAVGVSMIGWMVWLTLFLFTLKEQVTLLSRTCADNQSLIQAVRQEQDDLRDWKLTVAATLMTTKDSKEIMQLISEIRQTLARLPTSFPPDYFVQRVDKFERTLDTLNSKLDAHMGRDGGK